MLFFYDNYSNKALIHTSPKKFGETEVSPWKRVKCFPLTEKLENAKLIGHFRFVFEEKLGQENHLVIVTSPFLKSSVFQIFSVQTY